MAVSRVLPAEPAALAAVLPDVPSLVYARSLLLSGGARVRLAAAGATALVLEPTTAVLVGRPDQELLCGELAGDPPGPTLLVQVEALRTVCAALPGWTSRPFIVHALPRRYPTDIPRAPGVIVSAPLDPAVLTGLPDDMRRDAADSAAVAVRLIDGVPVSVCAVSDLTETLWDVGIHTVESARRQGHGAAVFSALAATMAAQGQQPVWAAYEDYVPSLAMAERLGFRPVARMAELTPGLRA